MGKSILIGVAALLSACGIDPDMVVMQDVDRSSWDKTTTIVYENKAIEMCDMDILLRVNNHFASNHATLQITMFTPDSLQYTEQVTLPIKSTELRPNIVAADIEIPYRRNVHLRCKGEYTWHITPLESIGGVESAGIYFHIKE